LARVNVDGVGIEYEVTGGGGRRSCCCNGFPDSGRLWRHQVPALAGAGDSRSSCPTCADTGRSDKPEAVEAYSLMHIAGGRPWRSWPTLNAGRAHVVGHDWGAALAWALASFRPDQVGSPGHAHPVGHPATFRRTPRQREKSWYMLLFQFPGQSPNAG